jgi:hypothetical protein
VDRKSGYCDAFGRILAEVIRRLFRVVPRRLKGEGLETARASMAIWGVSAASGRRARDTQTDIIEETQ